jgi:hypothetical protein
MAAPDYSIVIPEAGDPPTQADVVKVFAKDVAGISQLFALASDGTVSQLTPTSTGPVAPSAAGDTVVAVSSVAPGTQIIAANASRRGFLVGNCAGGRTIYLRLGATAATATQYAVALAPGATYELPFPVYTGAIQALASGGGAVVLVQELT